MLLCFIIHYTTRVHVYSSRVCPSTIHCFMIINDLKMYMTALIYYVSILSARTFIIIFQIVRSIHLFVPTISVIAKTNNLKGHILGYTYLQILSKKPPSDRTSDCVYIIYTLYLMHIFIVQARS